jgi:hypothetical protein
MVGGAWPYVGGLCHELARRACTAVIILGLKTGRYMSLGSIVGIVASFLAMLALMIWGRPPVIYRP